MTPIQKAGKKYRSANKEKEKARNKLYWDNHPGERARLNRKQDLRRKFGITPEQYESILLAQGGVCSVCKRPCSSGRRLAVDHCHTTGKVRGLLCGNCNRGIGNLQDDPGLLETAAAYLRNS